MPGEPESPSPFPRSPLLQTEGRPFLVTLTALLLVLLNLAALSYTVKNSGGHAGAEPLMRLGMILAGFGYWAMRRFAVVLVAVCSVLVVVVSWRAGLEPSFILRAAAMNSIYLLPGVIFWSRMK